MAVRIITDTSSDLSYSQAQNLDVELIPMTICFGEKEFRAGIDISNEEFYSRLVRSQELPTTSQPTPFAFSSVYKKVKENGDTAVVLCVSSALSGTYQSAVIAADGYEDCIHVVDSLSVSVGQRILLEYALKLRSNGADAVQIVRSLEEKKKHVCVYGAVDTLEYLIKGGRLSKAAGAVGSMLGIRPVLCITDGSLAVVGKARGPKATVSTTHDLIIKSGVDLDMPCGIGYTGTDPAVAETFLEAVGTEFLGGLTPVYPVGSTVGTHTGPGLYLAAFFQKS